VLDAAHRISLEITYRPELKQDVQRIREAFGVALEPRRREFTDFSSTAAYSAVPYLPPAVGVAMGMRAESPPVAILYLGRLTNLACWVWLTWWSLRLVGSRSWLLFQAALLPMQVSLAAGLSADALTLGLSNLLIARIVASRLTDSPAAWRRHARALLLLQPLLMLCKGYLPLLGLVFLAPGWRHDRKTRFWLLGGLACGIGAFAGWYAFNPHMDMLLYDYTDPQAQKAFLRSEPGAAAAVIFRSIATQGFQWRQIVAGLGWSDVPVWPAVHWSYLVLLIGSPLLFTTLPPLTIPEKLIAAAVCAITVLGVYLRLFFISSPPWPWEVWGVAGRYFLPILPVFLLVFTHGRGRGFRICASRTSGLLLLIANLILLLLTTWCIVSRYYVPGAQG